MGRSSTCYSPVRHFTQGRSPFRVRLACVRHAASVQSEPESNSPVKLLTPRLNEALLKVSFPIRSALVKEPIRPSRNGETLMYPRLSLRSTLFYARLGKTFCLPAPRHPDERANFYYTSHISHVKTLFAHNGTYCSRCRNKDAHIGKHQEKSGGNTKVISL